MSSTSFDVELPRRLARANSDPAINHADAPGESVDGGEDRERARDDSHAHAGSVRGNAALAVPQRDGPRA